MKTLTPKSGSILVEALLAVVILSITLTLTIEAMSASLRASVYSEDYTTVIALAEDKMYELMKNGFIERGVFENRNFSQPYQDYKYTLQTRKLSSDLDSTLNQVDLEVTWSKGKRSNQLHLTTYLLNPPDE